MKISPGLFIPIAEDSGLDQSFISDIGHDHLDEDIIRIVVAIAHTMGIHVIAEGVETNEQLGFLSSIGCDLVQGWFFSIATDARATTEMINHIDTTYQDCFKEFHLCKESLFTSDRFSVGVSTGSTTR